MFFYSSLITLQLSLQISRDYYTKKNYRRLRTDLKYYFECETTSYLGKMISQMDLKLILGFAVDGTRSFVERIEKVELELSMVGVNVLARVFPPSALQIELSQFIFRQWLSLEYPDRFRIFLLYYLPRLCEFVAEKRFRGFGNCQSLTTAMQKYVKPKLPSIMEKTHLWKL